MNKMKYIELRVWCVHVIRGPAAELVLYLWNVVTHERDNCIALWSVEALQ